jgi:hypothetical protein
MKTIGLALVGLLFLGQAAAAFPTWSAIAFATTPQNAPAVVAAADKFMSSAIGKEFPGRLLLQVHMADGDDPATHSFVPLYKSAADREAYVKKVMDDPAWADFEATMARVAEPASNVMFRTLKSWGEVVDSDVVWMSFAFAVEDPAGFVGAIDRFMASETGKKFPGQVHLEAVMAGGMSPVTHTVVVGYASEAEMEAWTGPLMGNADWAACLEASRPTGKFLGASLVRTVKSWGPLSLDDLAVR